MERARSTSEKTSIKTKLTVVTATMGKVSHVSEVKRAIPFERGERVSKKKLNLSCNAHGSLKRIFFYHGFHDFELTNAADSADLPYRQLKSREIIHCGISP